MYETKPYFYGTGPVSYTHLLHVQQTQEAAAEAEAQRGAGLQLKGQGGVVQLDVYKRQVCGSPFCLCEKVVQKHPQVFLNHKS